MTGTYRLNIDGLDRVSCGIFPFRAGRDPLVPQEYSADKNSFIHEVIVFDENDRGKGYGRALMLQFVNVPNLFI